MKQISAIIVFLLGWLTALPALAQPAHSLKLPTPLPEAKAGVRWWWPGSAVTDSDLQWNLNQYASHGIGAVEITPIYGVKGFDRMEVPYLSANWMSHLRYTEQTCNQLHMETDMATGTGWPFGGPWVPLSEAACKVLLVDTVVPRSTPENSIRFTLPARQRPFARQYAVRSFNIKGQPARKRVIALYIGRTLQKVKRAAPGGDGWVIDHFDSLAVAHYLHHIDSAFTASGTPFPHTFFNDSYEVYGADWTPTLPEVFQRNRGYSLIDHLDQFADGDTTVVADYRRTLGEMLLSNFTRQWTAWAHSHGAITRNQAHGSPANLLDCYGAVDIPEIEGFGLTNFGIRGLRQDSAYTRHNFSDWSMLKYASSAAHVMNHRFTSSETFTWLTEHFRTSLSQMKPDLDLMFAAGVNHMFFHGTCYSPKNAPWPGWKFYASVDMSPTNSIWRDAPWLMKYIERCQTWLQWGRPDNDFLVYLPLNDMWRQHPEQRLMLFDIHHMVEKAPRFIRTILDIDSLGFDCDYVSDHQLGSLTVTPDHSVLSPAGIRYSAIIIPDGTTIDARLAAALQRLKGAHIIYGVNADGMNRWGRREYMRSQLHLKLIRRANDGGWHYFVANLTPCDVHAWVRVGCKARQAVWFNPMDSTYTRAAWHADSVLVNLRSGESRLLLALADGTQLPQSLQRQPADTLRTVSDSISLTQAPWQLSFTEDEPRVDTTFTLSRLDTWEHLSPRAVVTMGTGIYTTTFKLSKKQAKQNWQIELGDVRESARVYINGEMVGCAWAAPFVLNCGKALRRGTNTLRIEVTNLPANRIADMDRRGVEWRNMKEIGIVDINYKHTKYDRWAPVKSGLAGPVMLKAYDR